MYTLFPINTLPLYPFFLSLFSATHRYFTLLTYSRARAGLGTDSGSVIVCSTGLFASFSTGTVWTELRSVLQTGCLVVPFADVGPQVDDL